MYDKKHQHHKVHDGLTKLEIDEIEKVVEKSIKHARHHEHELKQELKEAIEHDKQKKETKCE